MFDDIGDALETVESPRRRGRPALPLGERLKDRNLSVGLPSDVLAVLERRAREMGVSKTALARRLIADGLGIDMEPGFENDGIPFEDDLVSGERPVGRVGKFFAAVGAASVLVVDALLEDVA